ncbi:MAG TPA: TetR/AcrR family transcriptional regulator [Acidimicrobiales bacterium]
MATTPARRPGRPRDARADEAILEAAAAVLAEQGPGGFTVDAVAARAGRGKATIYRRWPSRAHLMLDTARLAGVVLDDPDTGSVVEDLVTILGHLAEKLTTSSVGPLVAATIAEAAVNEETRKVYAEFIGERRAVPVQVVQRAIDRGELRADADPDLVVDIVSGPVFLRAFMSQAPLDETVLRRVVTTVLEGVRAR